jgi:hypothetical protein
LEPTIIMFEWVKTFYALDHIATVIGRYFIGLPFV